ncbi:ribosome small subunit-dependent GTPase A [Ideonella dechloratans]|uniref:Small ribosomal subunit biogenesis GTPase RsgA n=1 Tax=Ideonella dechloratans TaxID=36863 RepID=A0A643FCQ0_IDEDE|nr:ribosome small subunit-dependent GTPase A [Ideonella dechloratans]KAB0578951.1 ribosome small subunit-dependent GTPase A [Ideonella dechloratans]UFU09118.1 ribosome small subunit-dependent GTPase A [Ideonella dechloratans]
MSRPARAGKAKTAHATLQEALVVGSHGRHVVIETASGERLLAHPRGKKSAAVVGDRVRWAPAGDEAVIEALEPRRNLLMRQDEWRSKSFAANLDQLLVMLAGEPMFSESQLTRALIAAEDAGIRALLLLNKVDLPSAALARERLAPYRAMGLTVLETSLKGQPEAAQALLGPVLAGHTTLVLGPSGMGKSTLINLMLPQAQAQVGEISQALNAGRHTTTTTTWYWLGDAVEGQARGALIDSPGFQEFGLMHITPQRLPELMPDLRAQLGHCRFYNCTHRHEPGCGVREAVDRGEISPTRYRLYEALWDELEAGQRPG